MRKTMIVIGALCVMVGWNSFHRTRADLQQRVAESSAVAAAEPELSVDAAEWSMKRRLKDPGSARFTDVAQVRHGDTLAVCGHVNSRNAQGGMTGRKAFVVSGALVLSEEETEPGPFRLVWNRLCVSKVGG